MSAALEATDLSVSYGRVSALSGVSLAVKEGEISVVLGSNGAGKSSLLRALLGLVSAESGSIRFADRLITKLPPHRRIARGLVLVPEGRCILTGMTIEENLLLGGHLRADSAAIRRELATIYERFSNLAERRHFKASCLSGGEQQMLAIGRALLAKPKLMMLDEPSLGLSPLFISRLFELIQEQNKAGLTVLLVEQNTAKALAIAHKATVLKLGRVIMCGNPKDLIKDPRLQEAYLGQTQSPQMSNSQLVS